MRASLPGRAIRRRGLDASVAAPPAPLAAPCFASVLGRRGSLAPAISRLGFACWLCRQVTGRCVEAEGCEAFREMGGKLGRDVDRPAVRMVDAQSPGMEVQLAADAAGQEGFLAGIFAVADDRMADRRKVDPQLVGA